MGGTLVAGCAWLGGATRTTGPPLMRLSTSGWALAPPCRPTLQGAIDGKEKVGLKMNLPRGRLAEVSQPHTPPGALQPLPPNHLAQQSSRPTAWNDVSCRAAQMALLLCRRCSASPCCRRTRPARPRAHPTQPPTSPPPRSTAPPCVSPPPNLPPPPRRCRRCCPLSSAPRCRTWWTRTFWRCGPGLAAPRRAGLGS